MIILDNSFKIFLLPCFCLCWCMGESWEDKQHSQQEPMLPGGDRTCGHHVTAQGESERLCAGLPRSPRPGKKWWRPQKSRTAGLAWLRASMKAGSRHQAKNSTQPRNTVLAHGHACCSQCSGQCRRTHGATGHGPSTRPHGTHLLSSRMARSLRM